MSQSHKMGWMKVRTRGKHVFPLILKGSFHLFFQPFWALTTTRWSMVEYCWIYGDRRLIWWVDWCSTRLGPCSNVEWLTAVDIRDFDGGTSTGNPCNCSLKPIWWQEFGCPAWPKLKNIWDARYLHVGFMCWKAIYMLLKVGPIVQIGSSRRWASPDLRNQP